MAFWSAARLMAKREALALHCLGLAGYTTYCPRLREWRLSHGRRIEVRPLVFPGYCFVWIELQWHRARWAPGTLGLIMNGAGPAHVPDAIIAELRASEHNGLIELPTKPPRFRRGDKVRITRGPFREHLALYDGQPSHERVAVLLQLLGSRRRVELSEGDVEAVSNPRQRDTNGSQT